MQRDWLLIQAHHRFLRIVGLLVRRQNILHLGNIFFIQFRHAPHFFPPRQRSWWRSRTRMVSLPRSWNQAPLSTASSATSRTVQRGATFRWVAADHGDDALFLTRCPVTWPLPVALLLIERAFQSPCSTAVRDPPNRLQASGEQSLQAIRGRARPLATSAATPSPAGRFRAPAEHHRSAASSVPSGLSLRSRCAGPDEPYPEYAVKHSRLELFY